MLRITLLFLLCFPFLLFAQNDCGFDDFGIYDHCGGFPRTTIYSSDIDHSISLEYFTQRSQGPYEIQMNGKIFENQYLFTFESLCCDGIYASDFGYDFEIPGTYQFSIESISHNTNECVAVNGNPLSQYTVTVIPRPTFDFKYTCLQNGDVRLDIILTSQIEAYSNLFFRTFSAGTSSTFIGSNPPMPGDIIYSEIATLNANETYPISIRDCVSSNPFVNGEYTHNCTSCVDTNPPIANCKDFTIALNNQEVELDYTSFDDGSLDDCGIVSYMVDEYDFDCSDIGQNTVVLEVSDAAGNISECTSIVTVQDPASTCSTCYTLDKTPTIEFSHTELNGNDVKIWYRITDFSKYAHLNARTIRSSTDNFVFTNDFGVPYRTRFFTDLSGDKIEEFMFLRLDRDFQFQDCDRIELSLMFTDLLCDVTYTSNSLILNCDNDNDGFTIDEDCDDNNPNSYFGAVEICDGFDNNCDGQIDEGFENIFGNCCPFELDVNAPSIVAGTYKADYRINSSGDVDMNNVVLRAGSEVNLESGFEVTVGSIFHAHIAPCN